MGEREAKGSMMIDYRNNDDEMRGSRNEFVKQKKRGRNNNVACGDVVCAHCIFATAIWAVASESQSFHRILPKTHDSQHLRQLTRHDFKDP